MKNLFTIARKEYTSSLDSPLAYLILGVFLGLCGFFTWLYGTDIFLIGQATLQPFFSVAYWAVFMLAPAVSMRLMAEEKRLGTLEWLLTKPVTDFEVVAGKWLAGWLLVLTGIALTLPYYLSVWWLAHQGNIDHGSVWCGYLGLVLEGAAYVSVGLFASALTGSQVVAFILAVAMIFPFHILFGLVAGTSAGTVAELLDWLSAATHFESMARGVLDVADLTYFIVLTLAGLVATEAVLTRRHLIKTPVKS